MSEPDRPWLVGTREQGEVAGAPFHVWPTPDGRPWIAFHRSDSGYLLRFPDLADFEIGASGSPIHGWSTAGVSTTTLDHLYLNQVLPLARSAGGSLVLHGSAVEAGSTAIAFLGASGLGKSTLAASFATSGHRFLVDDGVVLAESEGQFLVEPSHASIRLWSDSHAALLADRKPSVPPVAYSPKARFLAGDGVSYCPVPRPLLLVFVLAPESGDDIDITPISPAEAMIEVSRHSFLIDVEKKEAIAFHFDEIARLVRAIPFHRLSYRREFARLSQVRRSIIKHAGMDTGNGS